MNQTIPSTPSVVPQTRKTRYALIGCGGRGIFMFAKPIVQRFAHSAELVGFCDLNQGRMDYANRVLETKLPTYTDFDRMLQDTNPDVVIVCTVDSTHHEFIIRALRHGCDVISEKPMTIDAEKCRDILAAERETGRRLTVTFNYRFIPYCTRIKELLGRGAIGKILSVDFNYLLDRSHGADYFRRWHARKENSGGLLVHKSTHHFDLVNWWLDQDPEEVFAFGSRQFYGPTREQRGERCLTCGYKNTCEFYFDINTPPDFGTPFDTAELYRNVEHLDGYIRDRCVFDDRIDIEDTLTLAVRYAGGTQLSYSLNAHCIHEGWQIAFNGTGGRLEAAEWHGRSDVPADTQDIVIHRPGKAAEVIRIPVESGDHGGGDRRLHHMLFEPGQPDPMGHMASSKAGAMSILTGIASNQSIATGKPVLIAGLNGER